MVTLACVGGPRDGERVTRVADAIAFASDVIDGAAVTVIPLLLFLDHIEETWDVIAGPGGWYVREPTAAGERWIWRATFDTHDHTVIFSTPEREHAAQS